MFRMGRAPCDAPDVVGCMYPVDVGTGDGESNIPKISYLLLLP